jgi:hypothetical protein
VAFERTKHFLDTFGEPRPPRPQIIPGPYRIPFYLALSLVSLIALIVLVWFVVIPGVRSYSNPAATPAVPSAGSNERKP